MTRHPDDFDGTRAERDAYLEQLHRDEVEREPRWFFTFGYCTLVDSYIVIEAPDENAARRSFVEQRAAAGIDPPNRYWSSVYNEGDFAVYAAKYGPLTEVPVTTPAREVD